MKDDNNTGTSLFLAGIIICGLLFCMIHGFVYGLLIRQPATKAEQIFWQHFVTGSLTGIEKLSVILVFILFVTGALVILWLFKMPHIQNLGLLKNRFTSYKGTASWASLSDYSKLLGSDGFLLGKLGFRQVRLSKKASYEHLMVVGPTGCGKTSSFIIPNILSLSEGWSVVVSDPKGEIAAVTEQHLKNRGWNILKFNPTNPDQTDKYNPLLVAKDEVEIAEIAEIILRNCYSAAGNAGDSQWVTFSLPLWEYCLLVEKYTSSKRPPSVQGAFSIAINWDEPSREQMARALGGKALTAYKIYCQSLNSPETAASIRTVLTSCVKLFTRSDIEQSTSRDSFYPVELRQKPTALFFQIPERKSELMKPFMATMYWQLMEHIIDTPGLPVMFLLDEFANIGKIPGFAQMAATVRSRNIALCIILQDIGQLSREYSREEQKDIVNNMKTKMFYPGLTGETGELCQQAAGHTTVSSNKFAFLNFSKDPHTWESRPLITPDELRRIPDGYALILAHNANPLLIQTVPYFKKSLIKFFG